MPISPARLPRGPETTVRRTGTKRRDAEALPEMFLICPRSEIATSEARDQARKVSWLAAASTPARRLYCGARSQAKRSAKARSATGGEKTPRRK